MVAIAQTASRPGDVEANVDVAAGLIATAGEEQARLLMFPEMSLVGYDLAGLMDQSAWVTADDSRLDSARLASEKHNVTAVLGAAFRDDYGRPWLASLVLWPDGRMWVHGKRHLHGPERDLFHPGEPGRLLDIDGWQVALAVCYDAGVPKHAENAADRGAEVYALSALYNQDEIRRFDIHLAARAMDHRMYALAANHAGDGPGWKSCGGSGVWHPDGRRLIQAGIESDLLITALSRRELRDLRERDARAGYPHGRS